jgi:predicted nucleic acid-binding protein
MSSNRKEAVVVVTQNVSLNEREFSRIKSLTIENWLR